MKFAEAVLDTCCSTYFFTSNVAIRGSDNSLNVVQSYSCFYCNTYSKLHAKSSVRGDVLGLVFCFSLGISIPFEERDDG